MQSDDRWDRRREREARPRRRGVVSGVRPNLLESEPDLGGPGEKRT
jgi:hypothetical protein